MLWNIRLMRMMRSLSVEKDKNENVDEDGAVYAVTKCTNIDIPCLCRVDINTFNSCYFCLVCKLNW